MSESDFTPLLVRADEDESAWYPVSIRKLDHLLKKVVRRDRGYSHPYALRKNIAYNLQYIQFVDRYVQDLKLSSVLQKQSWKAFIVVGSGIIESLLHFLLVAHALDNTTEWDRKAILPGNPKRVEGKYVKADTHLYERLSSPDSVPMTFDAMLKKAEA